MLDSLIVRVVQDSVVVVQRDTLTAVRVEESGSLTISIIALIIAGGSAVIAFFSYRQAVRANKLAETRRELELGLTVEVTLTTVSGGYLGKITNRHHAVTIEGYGLDCKGESEETWTESNIQKSGIGKRLERGDSLTFTVADTDIEDDIKRIFAGASFQFRAFAKLATGEKIPGKGYILIAGRKDPS